MSVKTYKLGRKRAARQALLRNLAVSLILHEKIKTTQPKAKALRPKIEHLIEIGKKGTLASKRHLVKELGYAPAVLKMVQVLAPRYQQRHGGYLRMVRLLPRRGDRAPMAQVELLGDETKQGN